MRVAAASDVAQPTIAQRLESISMELEREFHELRSDIARRSHPRYAELMSVAEKIDFARYCVSCAAQVANDRRVSLILEG